MTKVLINVHITIKEDVDNKFSKTHKFYKVPCTRNVNLVQF